MGDLKEGGLGEVEMVEGRVAPPAVVVGKSEVWRAEVGGSDDDGAREAPLRVVVATHLVT